MRARWLVAAAVALALPTPGQAATPPPGAAQMDPVLELAALDRHLADIDSQEKSDKAELAQTAEGVSEARERVVIHGRAFFKLTRAGLLPVGGGFDALVRHAMLVERARRRLIRDLGDQRRAQGRAEDIAHELDRLARDQSDLASQRETIAAARTQMEDDARREQAFDRAFETSGGAPSGYVAVYGGAGGVAPDVPAGGFASAKGRLLFPVIGRAEVRAARREGTSGPGIEILADAGSVVRAAFGARVAFADRYGSYGRIVILDHGDHYYTVSGNLDSIDVKVGQEVDAGDRIGTVGDDGQGPMLYFEVRRGSQTVAPGPWLGL